MHFYTEVNGEVKPKHFVENKSKGGLRPSRVTDAKKAAKEGEVWFSSVTSVLNILDKPALVNWKVQKHLDTVFDMHQSEAIESEDLEGWSRKVKAKTQEALDAAPKAGTDIHQVLEDFFKLGKSPSNEIELKLCENVQDIITNLDAVTPWNYEKYFVEKNDCYAGCADLVSDTWVIDYKSKQEAAKFKVGKMQYPEHIRQLAAYGNALCEEGFRAANIFVCLETGEVDFHECDEVKLANGWLDFKDCLSIYQRNTYNPKGEK